MLALAVLPAVLAVAFATHPAFLEDLWPLPRTGDGTFVFLASILAAAAASTAWAAWQGETVSFGGIALDVMVIFWPLALWLPIRVPAERGGGITAVSVVAVVAAVFGTWLATRTVRAPFIDRRPTPRLVRVGFAVFVVTLTLVGGAVVAGRPNTVPWSVSADLSVMIGLIFRGAASYFVFGLARPGWTNAGGQLAGFLAYDLVLIPPLAGKAGSIPGYWRDSLWAYLAVLVASGLIAAWYLFLDRRTRLVARP